MVLSFRTWVLIAVTVLMIAPPSSAVSSHNGTGECRPCCGPAQMSEPLTLSPDSRSLHAASGCAVAVFDRPRLHHLLRGRWLYFAGDSSTRGLVLALFYEIIGAPALLQRTVFPSDKHNATALRTMMLFQYGDNASRAECKEALVTLGRANKWSLEDCDDAGDPCGPQPAPPAGEFMVEDLVVVAGAVGNSSVLNGMAGEVVGVRDDLVDIQLEEALPFPDRDLEGSARTVALPKKWVRHDTEAEAKHRCKRSRGTTHSVASLHLGFLDAGFCHGKLEFIKVAPHDYSEGSLKAPLGAQVRAYLSCFGFCERIECVGLMVCVMDDVNVGDSLSRAQPFKVSGIIPASSLFKRYFRNERGILRRAWLKILGASD